MNHAQSGKPRPADNRFGASGAANVLAGQLQCIGSPTDLLLARLAGARRAGKGWAAKCPAHADRSPSLAIAEGDDGRVLLKCYAGCDALSIVQALGLTLADLFPRRLPDMTREGRADALRAWRQTGWAAAFNVLAREATVVLIAARMLQDLQAWGAEDDERLALAVDRIESAREVLT